MLGYFYLDKSLDVLDLGNNQLRKIPVKDDFTISVEKLKEQILEDRSAGY